MARHCLSYRQSSINYHVFGKGNKLLFAFHGYGEDGSSFFLMEKMLGNDYTIIAPDFPFHGATAWKEGLVFKPDVLLEIMEQITLSIDKSIDWNTQKFDLIGYSMGGRVALHLLQTKPQQITRAVLVAPDGLHKNFWYWFSTQTWAGNKLFGFTMKHPRWFFGLMKIGKNMGMVNKSVFKFAHAYLDDKHARLTLYNRWTAMRKFGPRLALVKSRLTAYHIPLRLLFGSYDRIILSHRSNFLTRNDQTDIRVSIIEAGHQLLKEKYAEDIASLFYA